MTAISTAPLQYDMRLVFPAMAAKFSRDALILDASPGEAGTFEDYADSIVVEFETGRLLYAPRETLGSVATAVQGRA